MPSLPRFTSDPLFYSEDKKIPLLYWTKIESEKRHWLVNQDWEWKKTLMLFSSEKGHSDYLVTRIDSGKRHLCYLVYLDIYSSETL